MSGPDTPDTPSGNEPADIDVAREALVAAARGYLEALGTSAGVAQVAAHCYAFVGDLASIRTLVETVDPEESPTTEVGKQRARSGKPPTRYALNPLERNALIDICAGHHLDHGIEVYETLRRRGLAVVGMGGKWHATPAGKLHCEAMKRLS
jgi:hypothetical protein